MKWPICPSGTNEIFSKYLVLEVGYLAFIFQVQRCWSWLFLGDKTIHRSCLQERILLSHAYLERCWSFTSAPPMRWKEINSSFPLTNTWIKILFLFYNSSYCLLIIPFSYLNFSYALTSCSEYILTLLQIIWVGWSS